MADIQAKIAELEAEMARTQKNKATNVRTVVSIIHVAAGLCRECASDERLDKHNPRMILSSLHDYTWPLRFLL